MVGLVALAGGCGRCQAGGALWCQPAASAAGGVAVQHGVREEGGKRRRKRAGVCLALGWQGPCDGLWHRGGGCRRALGQQPAQGMGRDLEQG